VRRQLTIKVEPLLSTRAKGLLDTLIRFVEVGYIFTSLPLAESAELPFNTSTRPLFANAIQDDVLPAEHLYHTQLPEHPFEARWSAVPPVMEELKAKAKKLGLWNLWLSGGDFQGMAGGEGGGLTNLEVGHASGCYCSPKWYDLTN
jgi:hypothetical protein